MNININRWIKTAVVSIAVIAALASYKIMEIRAEIAFGESFPEASETVESVIAQQQVYRETVKVLGEMISPQQVELRSELPGRIVDVNFQSGERVASDQLLLQLDISEELAQLDSARARLELAGTLLRRNTELLKRNAVSQEQLDRSKAELATVKAEIAVLNSTIRKKTIRAPFAGLTGLHQFEVGQFLLNNVTITQLVGEQDFVWVDFSVPQFYPALEQGSIVQVARIIQSGKEQWVDAQVIASSPVVTVANRSFQYRAKVMKADFPALINAAVVVKVPVAEPDEIIVVPVSALQNDNLGQFVFLLSEDKEAKGYRAVRQQVQVATRQGEQVFLVSGVKPGQLLAGAGAFKLHSGLLVFSEANMARQGDNPAGDS